MVIRRVFEVCKFVLRCFVYGFKRLFGGVMKSLSLFIAAIVLLITPIIGYAASPTTVPVVDNISSKDLNDLMKKQGYTITIEDDDKNRQLWMIDGLKGVMVVKGQTLQFIAVCDGSSWHSPRSVLLDKANDWNLQHRFSQCFVINEDFALELDLDLTGGVTEDRIVDFAKTCRQSFEVWNATVVIDIR